ncbi:MAG: hypothetical protein DRJ60_00175 [Thermoprotei archaeon]|nr:MAG: hypothetical protein DRJ60_00175 [Thermoprotei archaeon]
MSLSSRLDEVTATEATQLHLFLSIIILMLLLRFSAVAPEPFDVALFSCISMPATYALTYYHARAHRMGRFVARKKPEPTRLWSHELAALMMSFAMSYIVFAALSGSTNYITFGAAFITVQVMRLLILLVTSHLKNMGVDIQHPIVILLVSLSVAAVGVAGLSITFAF